MRGALTSGGEAVLAALARLLLLAEELAQRGFDAFLLLFRSLALSLLLRLQMQRRGRRRLDAVGHAGRSRIQAGRSERVLAGCDGWDAFTQRAPGRLKEHIKHVIFFILV